MDRVEVTVTRSDPIPSDPRDVVRPVKNPDLFYPMRVAGMLTLRCVLVDHAYIVCHIKS